MKLKRYLIIIFLGIIFLNGKNKDKDISSNKYQIKKNDINIVQDETKPVTEILKPIWNIGAEHGFGSPLVENGIVFLPMNLKYAVDAQNGRKLFFKDEETKIYFKENFKDSIVLFNSQNRVSILNLYSGDVIYDLKRTRSWPFFNTPEILKNNLVCVLKDNNHLITLDLITQEVLWTFETDNSLYDKIIIDKKEIYVTDKKNFYCFSHDGDIRWQIELGEVVCNPVVKGNILYAYVIEKGIYALNLHTREIEWFYKHDYNFKYIGRKIIVDERNVYFIGPDLYAINRYTGVKVWTSSEFGSSITDPLLFINQFILAYSDTEKIPYISILTKDGKLVYKLFTSDIYPPASRTETFSYMDNFLFMFAENIENDLLIGLTETEDSLFCFQIKEPIVEE